MTEPDPVAAAVADLAAAFGALIAAIQASRPAVVNRWTPQTMVTVAEAAEILRCSKTHIYALMKGGYLEWVGVGHKRLISAAEISRMTEHGGG